jgi:hypothetical protein
MRHAHMPVWQGVWVFWGLTGKRNSGGKGGIQGSLRCAVHGVTVNSFGRDDDFSGEGWEQQRRELSG